MGVVSLPGEIKTIAEEEIDSVSNEPLIGVHVLISNFVVDKFVCTGTCYCTNEEEGDRRSSLPLSRRGLLYLVSAVSSLVAVKRAEEYYSKECQFGLENECPHGSIVYSEVDHCESIYNEDVESTITEKMFIVDEDGSTEVISEEPDSTEFRCSGYCVRKIRSGGRFDREVHGSQEWNDFNDNLYNEILQSDQERHILLTHYHTSKCTGYINVDEFCQNLELSSKVSVERSKDVPFHLQEEKAMDVFTTVHLHKYCKSNSLFSVKEYKEKFFEFEDALAERMWDEYHEILVKLDNSETLNVCRGKRSYFSTGKDSSVEDPLLHFNNVVCSRIFTDDEWKKRIPYENENLRHWKEGYKMKPDKQDRDQMEKNMYRTVMVAFEEELKKMK